MPIRHLSKALILALAILCAPVHGQGLTPILMANGEDKMVCDGVMRFMYTTPLVNKTIVKAYLFGNLVTHTSYGADVVLWSPAYGGWGPIADLHIFPATVGGGRLGDRERSYSPDGIYIADSHVQVAAVCWGGGTLEIYAAIWVK